MTKSEYTLLENYMHSCQNDSAHDKEHVYRVLYTAMDIARHEADVDMDILITACLLHDVGRAEQLENPKLCHAAVGAVKAHKFLLEHGYSAEYADKVSDCIRTHRFRTGDPPASVEAKILFDSDKIDVVGAVGMARTLMYKAQTGEKLYMRTDDGTVSDGTDDTEDTFFHEYKFKLENIYAKFFTDRGREIALSRQSAAVSFYNSLFGEVTEFCGSGREFILDILK